MLLIEQTDEFAKWLKTLRDIKARAKIAARLRIAQLGNLGLSATASPRCVFILARLQALLHADR